jgi:1-deoxy-D-xylulose-5-phosphate reductoisomerase
MKNIVVLGSTGSVGTQTLDVVRRNPGMFNIHGLAAGSMSKNLMDQISEFQPRGISLFVDDLSDNVLPEMTEVVPISDLVSDSQVDYVIVAIPGLAALAPTLAALDMGKIVALASKEVLVVAGTLLKNRLESNTTHILPVDSEHSAIWQCLVGENTEKKELRRLILTASGGPFRGKTLAELESVTPEQALAHPTWRMGPKVTLDSATLMNKAFEVIEAHWLFNINYSDIDVIVHPESIFHSLVEFSDGTLKAQLSSPDMRLPIQFALSYPDRLMHVPDFPKLSIESIGALHFEPLDSKKFPCFNLGIQAGESGGTYPAVLNASDEVAVEYFLNGHLNFQQISSLIEKVLDEHDSVSDPGLGEILEADQWARARMRKKIEVLG